MGAILFQFFFILVSSPSSCCCCCWGCCCCGSGGCSSNRAPCCFWFVRAFLFEWISFLFVCLFVGSKMAVGEANGPVEDNSFDLEFANLFVSMNFRVRNSFFFLEGGGRERSRSETTTLEFVYNFDFIFRKFKDQPKRTREEKMLNKFKIISDRRNGKSEKTNEIIMKNENRQTNLMKEKYK